MREYATLFLVGLLVSTLGFTTGCRRAKDEPAADGPAVKVVTQTVGLQKVPETYEVVGTVRPKLSATVAAKLTAAVLSIPVKPGDAVKSGDPLAQLDDREARAEFERAEAEFKRNEKLLKDSVVTQSEFDASQERFRVAKAALSHATIVAPFDGIVAEKLCDVGDLATPGKPLFVVEQPTEFRLEAFVPERFAGLVKVGTKVRVNVEAVGEAGEGVVGEVVPASDPATRSFLMKVDLQPGKALKSGMFGRAQLIVGQREALLVPHTAVKQRGQLTFVYVAAEGRAAMRLVKAGKTVGDHVEILSGIQGGETVIVSSEGPVTDGVRVSS